MELPMPPPNFQYPAVVIDPPQIAPTVENERGKERKEKERRRHRTRSEPRDGTDSAATNASQIDAPPPQAERGRNRKEKKHKHRRQSSSAPAEPESPIPPLPPLPQPNDASDKAAAHGAESAAEGSEEKSTGRIKSVCPICYSTQANVMTLCGHGFCYQCLKAWLGDHDSCPVCRCYAQMEPDIPAHQVHGAVIYTSPSGRRIALRVDLNALLFGVKCKKCNTACIRACRIREEPVTMQCGVCSTEVAPPEDVSVLRALLIAKTSPSDVGFETKSLPPEPAPYQRHILVQDRHRPAYTRSSARCLVISSFLVICIALPCIYGGVKLLHTLGFILGLGLLVGSVCCISWGIVGIVWGCRRMRQAEARDRAPEENAHNPEP